MLVVSDTSPLRGLQVLGLTHLLPLWYGQVVVPTADAAELTVPIAAAGPFPFAHHPFIRVAAPSDLGRVQTLLQQVDKGEAEAIALALELNVTTILMDEVDGRAVARRLGLSPTGVLGMLVRAKRERLIAAASPLIERLEREIEFRVSAALRESVLRDAGEL
ncbi:MAG TPA: DUF3368 domain-containing protein [Phycisphaerales bacterium]|nr:DUF3368 domain-containing protein [Phycisphaerales bacterium]